MIVLFPCSASSSKVLEKHIHSKMLAFLDSTSTGAVDRCLPHFSIAADRCGWFSLKLGPSHVRGSSRVNTWPTLYVNGIFELTLNSKLT